MSPERLGMDVTFIYVSAADPESRAMSAVLVWPTSCLAWCWAQGELTVHPGQLVAPAVTSEVAVLSSSCFLSPYYVQVYPHRLAPEYSGPVGLILAFLTGPFFLP